VLRDEADRRQRTDVGLDVFRATMQPTGKLVDRLWPGRLEDVEEPLAPGVDAERAPRVIRR
jgi:hypothetical protein